MSFYSTFALDHHTFIVDLRLLKCNEPSRCLLNDLQVQLMTPLLDLLITIIGFYGSCIGNCCRKKDQINRMFFRKFNPKILIELCQLILSFIKHFRQETNIISSPFLRDFDTKKYQPAVEK